MPIYAFKCEACGHAFDRLQKLSDPDPIECPQCGACAVKRQLTAPSFRLAGSGWYETDFKSDKDSRRNLAVTDEPPAKKDEAAKATDAKPEKASTTAASASVAPAKAKKSVDSSSAD